MAEAVFAERGYEAASMADIARAAGMAVGSLYKFAPGKEQLYLAVFESHLGEFLERLSSVREEPDPLVAVRQVVERHLDYCDDHRDFFVLYVEDRFLIEWRLKERFGERCFELHLSYLELVTDVVRRAQSAGGLRAGDPEDLAHMLVSMINSTIFQWLHRGARTRLVERTELVVDHFLHGAASREPA